VPTDDALYRLSRETQTALVLVNKRIITLDPQQLKNQINNKLSYHLIIPAEVALNSQ
jgi:hypothetical protein